MSTARGRGGRYSLSNLGPRWRSRLQDPSGDRWASLIPVVFMNSSSVMAGLEAWACAAGMEKQRQAAKGRDKSVERIRKTINGLSKEQFE